MAIKKAKELTTLRTERLQFAHPGDLDQPAASDGCRKQGKVEAIKLVRP